MDRNNLGTVELSPDGTRVATGRNVEGNQDVYLLDAAGGMTRFTFNPDIDWFPIWYPRARADSCSIRGKRLLGTPREAVECCGQRATVHELGWASSRAWRSNRRLFSSMAISCSFEFRRLRVQPLDPTEDRAGKRSEFSTPGGNARWGQFSPNQRWVAYQIEPVWTHRDFSAAVPGTW